VLGLAVTASPREIDRQARKLQALARFGRAPATGGALLPLDPPPDAEAVRGAVRRLLDHRTRVVDELFWFWSEPTDPAHRALLDGDPDVARRRWLSRSDAGDVVAAHDAAVLAHARALDLELAAGEPDGGASPNGLWEEALLAWHEVIDSEAIEERMAARLEALRDPRLGPSAARRLSCELPGALLQVNARLAVDAVERGDAAATERLLDTITGSGFDAARVEEALQRAVEPARERARLLSQDARKQAEADPVRGHRSAERLMAEAGPLLQLVDRLLPDEHPSRQLLHDDVATAALSCQVKFGNRTDDWPASAQLLERALEIASGSSARTRIEENLEIVRRNADSNNDFRGPGYFELPGQVLEPLEEAADDAEAGRWDAAIGRLERLLGGDVPLDPSGRRLTRKALAYCLGMRSVRRVNAAVTKMNERPQAIQRALANQLGGLMGLLEGDGDILAALRRSGLGHGFGRPEPGQLSCDICRTTIWNRYINFTYGDIKVTSCVSCNKELDRELADRKQRTRRTIREAADDLNQASALDPENRGINQNFDTLKGLASQVDVTLPDPRVARLRGGTGPLKELVSGLTSRDRALREAAEEGFARADLRQEGAVELLTAAVPRHEGRPKRILMDGLGRCGEAAAPAVGVLVVAARFGDRECRAMAARSLGRIGPAAGGAVGVLVGLIQAPEQAVRQAAIEALGYVDQDWPRSLPALRALPGLIEQLAVGDPDRMAPALDGLAAMGPAAEEAVEPLLSLVAADVELVAAALVVLDAIAPDWAERDEVRAWIPRLAAMVRADDGRSAHAATLLGRLSEVGDEALAALIGALAARRADLRDAARAALEALDPDWPEGNAALDAVPLLEDALRNGHLLSAADALGRIGPDAADALTTLVELLGQADPAVREASASALDRIDPDWTVGEAAAAAVSALVQEMERGETAAVASVLGRIGPAAVESVPALVAALGDSEPNVRAVCAAALGSIMPSWHESAVAVEAVPGLVAQLRVGHVEGAASALGRIGPPAARAIPALHRAWRRASDSERGPIAEAMDRVRPGSLTKLRLRRAARRVAAAACTAAMLIFGCFMLLARAGVVGPAMQLEGLRLLDEQTTCDWISRPIPADHSRGIRERLGAMSELACSTEVIGRIVPLVIQPPDEALRGEAVGVLSGIEADPARDGEPILRLLASPDDVLREGAAEVLEGWDPAWEVTVPEQTIAWYGERLRQAGPAGRVGAASGLQRIGPPAAAALPELVALLDDPEYDVRAGGVMALDAIDADWKSAPATVEALAGWKSDAAEVTGPPLATALVAVLAVEPGWATTWEARRHRQRLATLVLDRDDLVAQQAFLALKLIDPDHDTLIECLLKELRSAQTLRREGDRIVEVFETIGPEASSAVWGLARIARSSRRKTVQRRAAIEALGHIGPGASSAVWTLRSALVDDRRGAGERRAAAVALGRIGQGARAALPTLDKAAKKDRAAVVRRAAAEAATLIRQARSTP